MRFKCVEKVGKPVGGSVSVYPANPGVNPPEYGGTRRAGFWFPWFRLNRGQKPEIKVPKFKLEFSWNELVKKKILFPFLKEHFNVTFFWKFHNNQIYCLGELLSQEEDPLLSESRRI